MIGPDPALEGERACDGCLTLMKWVSSGGRLRVGRWLAMRFMVALALLASGFGAKAVVMPAPAVAAASLLQGDESADDAPPGGCNRPTAEAGFRNRRHRSFAQRAGRLARRGHLDRGSARNLDQDSGRARQGAGRLRLCASLRPAILDALAAASGRAVLG